MITAFFYIAVFVLGVILGVLWSRSNPKESDAIYAAAKKAKAGVDALIKKAKNK